jgi:hypothetical protein
MTIWHPPSDIPEGSNSAIWALLSNDTYSLAECSAGSWVIQGHLDDDVEVVCWTYLPLRHGHTSTTVPDLLTRVRKLESILSDKVITLLDSSAPSNPPTNKEM